ncbi:2-oxo-4-hydroxy-4-carboxy-5-ureidoimidazoline decarboxylase [Phytoactinopolyspora endophytica]|uniref:2-oxo-4-hydroxy-4-carboxy-5-ureidoimidazoline decarboxylase n=1 Tax=Phytoactinopolyspora endophytica TaxID=1642495 RepID=UPI00101BDF36|nr:2-oxo-4-hydroxy-4-carboxy-5-ureidoimidazoline decarboxylase [Phytoactinopolyspora endophytica]
MSPGLTAFNDLSEAVAISALGTCCTAGRWIIELARARPYDGRNALLDTSDRVVAGLTPSEVDEALAGHPRIGDRTAAGSRSATEQSGMATAEAELQRLIAEGNRTYESTFGHVYLVCATGKTAQELLDILTVRLANDPATEHAVTKAELAKINRIRLSQLLDELATTGEDDVP